MKKLLLLCVTAVMMAGCEIRNPDGSINIERDLNFRLVFVDSCDYIMYGDGIAHRGNCRFCAKRRQKEIRDAVELLKGK